MARKPLVTNPKLVHILYSGDNRYVFLGVVGLMGIAAIPWYITNKDKMHVSHSDVMDSAEEARRARLSTSASSRQLDSSSR